MIKQNINTPIYLALLLMVGLFLSALAVPANAEHLDIRWTNATTRADGSTFNADTDLASIEIGCGDSATGPFDVFTVSVQNEDGQPTPTSFSTEAAPGSLKGCVAYSVDFSGLVSAPSNVAELTYNSPISALEDLQTHCYGSCDKAVNFNITINTGTTQ